MHCIGEAQMGVQREVPKQKLSNRPSMTAYGCVYSDAERDVVTQDDCLRLTPALAHRRSLSSSPPRESLWSKRFLEASSSGPSRALRHAGGRSKVPHRP